MERGENMLFKVDGKAVLMRLVELDLNQKKLAHKAGITPQSISNIMIGRAARAMTIAKIAKALDMPMENLIKA